MNLQELLEKWSIKCDVNTLLSMWNESHRSYHNLNHLNDLINQINENKSKYSENEFDKLMLTALFHDIIYDPSSETNEERSAEFFIECSVNKINSDILEVKQMILDTKSHTSSNMLSEAFNSYDMNIVQRTLEELLEWENGISEEFSIYPVDVYKEDRLKFLESLLDEYTQNTENLLNLIEYVKSK